MGRDNPDRPASGTGEVRNAGRRDIVRVYPVESARPGAGDGLFVTPAQLARANRLADLRWRRPTEDPRTGKCPDCQADGNLPPGGLGRLDHHALPAGVTAMNAFDLSPAQIRSRLILRARRAALAAGARPQPSVHPHGHGEVVAPAPRVPVVLRVSVVPGDVVQLAESDYRYADGALRLRIVRVRLDISEWYDGQWVWLEGIEIGPDDQDGAVRQVLTRVSALSHHEKTPESVTRASP